jgi:single-strand DNA-binding protein
MIIANIHGRAARDGELNQSKGGKSWCKVSVACFAGTDRKSGESLTQWVRVVAFGRVAEELARVRKGETISAIGRVELSRWTTQDGAEREDMQLIAEIVMTIRSARPGGQKDKSNGSQGDYSSSHRAQAPAQEAPFDDDIPF